MKKIKERNITEYNKDVNNGGGYVYTNFVKYSFWRATKRQTDELNKLIKSIPNKNLKILDVGCGDGIFTYEIYDTIKPQLIVGMDSAANAITVARNGISKKNTEHIKFVKGDIYDTHKIFKGQKFDVIVARGVLHHLYDPKKAIKSLTKVSNKIIILEPNGYNPLLKIIENVSPYHIRHEEKSYFPFWLNKVFKELGYSVKKQTFFSIIPYFCPKPVVKILEKIEPTIESLPFLKILLSGTNLVYYES